MSFYHNPHLKLAIQITVSSCVSRLMASSKDHHQRVLEKEHTDFCFTVIIFSVLIVNVFPNWRKTFFFPILWKHDFTAYFKISSMGGNNDIYLISISINQKLHYVLLHFLKKWKMAKKRKAFVIKASIW